MSELNDYIIPAEADNAPPVTRERIWELDAFRGICILCVVAVHLIFDLQYFAGFDFSTPRWFDFIQINGGVLFIILSGICVTLGHRFLKRGLIVFGAGMLITLVTIIMYKIGVADKDIIIYFGVLHLLGVCMLRIVWILFIFPLSPTLDTLYISYPVSWTITLAAHTCCYFYVKRKRYAIKA